MDEMSFGERLRHLREARGIGVRELGRLSGVNHATLSQAENGKRWVGKLPSYEDLSALARVFEMTVDELVDTKTVERAPTLSDAALMLRFGAETVPEEDAAPFLEEFWASARHGRNNLIPQNYDDMRPKPRGKRQPKPEPTTFKLRVSGNCLYKTVQDGEIVWFDTTLPREPVALVFAVQDDHEAHIKRLVARAGVPWLESDDGWAAPVDEHWRILAVGFTAQRALPIG